MRANRLDGHAVKIGCRARAMTERVLANETLVGQTIGQFTFRALLGEGGSSRVYKADRSGRLVQTIAVKILKNDLAEDAAFRKRFMEEANISASFSHPNILPIIDAGELGPHLFIAMQFVDGSDLADLIRRGPLPLDRAMSVLRQAAKALDAAHEHGLVHRDVKPSNFLLVLDERRGDHVYLTDFGIAKRGSAPTGLTRTGMFVGTAEYAAPELIRNEDVDKRADIYALGCVFYQCLTGIVPFDRPTEYAILSAHLNEPVPLLRERRPDLPAGLEQVIATAMAKDRAQRYRTCGELVAAAEAVVYPIKPPPPTDDFPIPEPGPKPPTKPNPTTPRSRWWVTAWNRNAVRVAALAVVVAIVAGVATAGFILARQIANTPTPAPSPTATATATATPRPTATPVPTPRPVTLGPNLFIMSLPDLPFTGFTMSSEQATTNNGWVRTFSSQTNALSVVQLRLYVYGPTESAATLVARQSCDLTFVGNPARRDTREVPVSAMGAAAKGCQYQFVGSLDSYEYITGTRNVLLRVLVQPRTAMSGADALTLASQVAQRQLDIIDRVAPK